jgi:hypothetical protein
MKFPKVKFPDIYQQPWKSINHMVIGVFHIFTGLAMVFSLGLYRPTWVGKVSLILAYYRYRDRNK